MTPPAPDPAATELEPDLEAAGAVGPDIKNATLDRLSDLAAEPELETPAAELPEGGSTILRDVANTHLEGIGFITARGGLFSALQGAATIDDEVIDGLTEYTKRAIVKAKVNQEPAVVIDTLEAELKVYDVVRRLRQGLKDIEERRAARAVLRGQGGAPPPSGAHG